MKTIAELSNGMSIAIVSNKGIYSEVMIPKTSRVGNDVAIAYYGKTLAEPEKVNVSVIELSKEVINKLGLKIGEYVKISNKIINEYISDENSFNPIDIINSVKFDSRIISLWVDENGKYILTKTKRNNAKMNVARMMKNWKRVFAVHLLNSEYLRWFSFMDVETPSNKAEYEISTKVAKHFINFFKDNEKNVEKKVNEIIENHTN